VAREKTPAESQSSATHSNRAAECRSSIAGLRHFGSPIVGKIPGNLWRHAQTKKSVHAAEGTPEGALNGGAGAEAVTQIIQTHFAQLPSVDDGLV